MFAGRKRRGSTRRCRREQPAARTGNPPFQDPCGMRCHEPMGNSSRQVPAISQTSGSCRLPAEKYVRFMRQTSPVASDSKIEGDVILTHLDAAINWMRVNSLWPMPMGLACCAIEFMAGGSPVLTSPDLARKSCGFRPGKAMS